MSLAPLASFWTWFRPQASTGASNVDTLFWFITGVSIVFTVLIFGLMGWFVWKYRARPGHTAQPSPHHSNLLEITWSVIPLGIVILIFGWGFLGYMDMRRAPGDAYEINVVAAKWNWSFQYPNGHISADLHVPKDMPVKLILSSSDVLHSLYIPAFRVKMDCVPGKYTSLWFNATESTPDGEFFDLFCTEYCGTGHSSMYAKVFVYETVAEFKAEINRPIWEKPPVEVGKDLYAKRGCVQCHSIDGKDNPGNGGPSFKGHYGKEQQFSNAGPVMMDENYIRESILYPGKRIRAGYRNIMPSYQGQLKDPEIYAIIQFIKSVNGDTTGEWSVIFPELAEGGEAAGQESQESEEADAAPPAEGATPAADEEPAEEAPPAEAANDEAPAEPETVAEEPAEEPEAA